MLGPVRTILYAALLLAPQSLLSEGGVCNGAHHATRKQACNSAADCTGNDAVCDPSRSGNCASGCHALRQAKPCFTDDECSLGPHSCTCVYNTTAPSPMPPVNTPSPATSTTPTGGEGVGPKDSPTPLGPADDNTSDGDGSTGTGVGIGVGITLLICCILCASICVYQARYRDSIHKARCEKLGLPETAKDWECGLAERRAERCQKVGLPATATVEECEYAERRQNLHLSSTATEQECAAVEMVRLKELREKREAWAKEEKEAEERALARYRIKMRQERNVALMATLHLPEAHTLPKEPPLDSHRRMLVGLPDTAEVEEVLRREERKHVCGAWDASDEVFQRAKDELVRVAQRARAREKEERLAQKAWAQKNWAENHARWAQADKDFEDWKEARAQGKQAERDAVTAKQEARAQATAKREATMQARKARDDQADKDLEDWKEARAQGKRAERAERAERDVVTAKREATTQARKVESDVVTAKRDPSEASTRYVAATAAAKKQDQQVATALVPEEQQLGAYHTFDGVIYYKGECIGHGGLGGLNDLGDGYAKNSDGTVWFHGKVVEGANAQYGSFHVAGNGYAINRGTVYYAGKKIGATTGMHETGLDHLGDGWSRTTENTYLFRGEAVSEMAARNRCPHFAERGQDAAKLAKGTQDNNYLLPEEQRLGAYHSAGIDGAIYYKQECIGHGGLSGLTDLGDGYAKNGETIWFHGKAMEGVTPFYGNFHVAGNGYAVQQGVVYYAGKKTGATTRDNATGLDHLGDGWSRTTDNTYLFRGEVFPPNVARGRCPLFKELLPSGCINREEELYAAKMRGGSV